MDTASSASSIKDHGVLLLPIFAIHTDRLYYVIIIDSAASTDTVGDASAAVHGVREVAVM